MALVKEAMYSRLTGFAGVSALVGTRVYPEMTAQKVTLPALTYSQISAAPDYVMGGQDGLSVARFQVNAWAASYSGAAELAEQVRLALSGFKGTVAAVVIDWITLEDLTDTPEEQAGEQPVIHGVSGDYMVSYREAIP